MIVDSDGGDSQKKQITDLFSKSLCIRMRISSLTRKLHGKRNVFDTFISSETSQALCIRMPLDETGVEFDEDKIDRIVSDVRDEAHLNALAQLKVNTNRRLVKL